MIEALESRLVLSTASTWSGMTSGSWLDAKNWDVAPASGNDLVFPAGASNLANTNDTAITNFGALTVKASGYAIGGAAVTLAGPIDASQASGASTVSLPITLGSPTVTVDTSGATLTLGGVLNGTAGLTKAGAGILDLTANNLYTGGTTVSAGILLVDGTQGDAATVAAGAILGGTGTIGSITSNGGTVAAGGVATGILTDTGDLTLDSASTLKVPINGTTAGTSYSQLSVGGTVNLNGATLGASLGYTPADNDSYTLINNTGSSPVSGTFNGLAQGAVTMIGGQPFQISYTGGDGNDVVLTHLASSSTMLTLGSSSTVFGQPVMLTANVSGTDGAGDTPGGTVEFLNGMTSLGTATLSGGSASINTSALPTGVATITVQYEGDSHFAPSVSGSSVVTVSEALTSTTFTTSTSSPVFGQPVTFTATVKPTSPGSGTPTGTVEFLNGSTVLGTGTLSGGVATLTTSSLPVGTAAVAAMYQGDTNFVTSTSTSQDFAVTQASTTTALTAAPTSATLGQSVTLTATIAPVSPGSGKPTGSVVFSNGTTTVGTATLTGGVATLTTNTLPLGTDAITAQYQGDSNFTTSTSAATNVSIGQSTTTVALSTSASPSVSGQTISFTATVTPTVATAGSPTGTVAFFNGTTALGTATLSNGVASLQTMTLPAGFDTITAQYQGSTSFVAGTSAPLVQQVNPATTITSTIASAANPGVGLPVTLTAFVTPVFPANGTLTGTVVFFDNGVTLGTGTVSNGQATFTSSTLPLGSQFITAVYTGDSNNFGSVAATIPIVVGTPTEQFVNQVYLQQLHVPATVSQLVYWDTVISQGFPRRKFVAEITQAARAKNRGHRG